MVKASELWGTLPQWKKPTAQIKKAMKKGWENKKHTQKSKYL